MSSKLRPFEALCLAFVISLGLPPCSSSAGEAEVDDHSYLPPWMLNPPTASAPVVEKAVPQKPRSGWQIAKVEPNPLKPDAAKTDAVTTTTADADAAKSDATKSDTAQADASSAAGLAPKLKQAGTKAVGFVNDLFERSVHFVRGE